MMKDPGLCSIIEYFPLLHACGLENDLYILYIMKIVALYNYI